jgi:hypothetical protein
MVSWSGARVCSHFGGSDEIVLKKLGSTPLPPGVRYFVERDQRRQEFPGVVGKERFELLRVALARADAKNIASNLWHQGPKLPRFWPENSDSAIAQSNFSDVDQIDYQRIRRKSL